MSSPLLLPVVRTDASELMMVAGHPAPKMLLEQAPSRRATSPAG